MFEDLYAPLPQVDAYLARIGYEGPVGLTEACLDQLVLRHQLSVPFENLDIRIRKTPVSLGIPQLFDKVVTRGRGGFCYELNGLFRALLEALGFRAWCCNCKVLKGEGPGHPALHRGVVVDLGGRLQYCDVGFGGPMPAGALPIEAGDEQCIGGDRYLLEAEPGVERGPWLRLSRRGREGGLTPLVSLDPRPVDPVDFLAGCHFCCCHHQNEYTDFTHKLLLNIRTADGYASLKDNVYRQREGDAASSTTLTSVAEMRGLMESVFLVPADFFDARLLDDLHREVFVA